MFKITGNQLLKIYLYFISFVTLTVAMFSGALVFQAAISYVAPKEFSYNIYTVNDPDLYMEEETYTKCYEAEVIEIDGQEYCWSEEDRRQDIVNGISIFASMVILFALHMYGIKKTEDKKTPLWLIKGYTTISLLTYSITGLIAIPAGIYETVNYFLMERGGNLTYAAAYPIGLTVLVLPLWFIFFNKMSKLKD